MGYIFNWAFFRTEFTDIVNGTKLREVYVRDISSTDKTEIGPLTSEHSEVDATFNPGDTNIFAFGLFLADEYSNGQRLLERNRKVVYPRIMEVEAVVELIYKQTRRRLITQGLRSRP